MDLRKSRKAFLTEYLCAIFFFGLSLLGTAGKINLPRRLGFFFLLLGIIVIILVEASIYAAQYQIRESKVIVIQGIFNKTKKNVFIDAITDVDLKQNYFQRLLRYGDLHIRSSSGAVTLELDDIEKPQQAMEILERLIEKYKNLRISQ